MPRPFRFSLQRVLEYRLQLEERAKIALATAKRNYEAQVAIVEGLRQDIAPHETSLYKEEPTAANMWLWRAYGERLQEDRKRAEARMLALARDLNQARREAVTKARERKLLERLKSNQALRHDQEQQLMEQKEFDEMATLRHQVGGA